MDDEDFTDDGDSEAVLLALHPGVYTAPLLDIEQARQAFEDKDFSGALIRPTVPPGMKGGDKWFNPDHCLAHKDEKTKIVVRRAIYYREGYQYDAPLGMVEVVDV